MRVLVIVKASKESEAGEMPTEQMLGDMGKYNEELVKAGVMEAGEGLHPSSKGKRVKFSGANRTVIDGPFAETKELVAGFWLWNVKSIDEAVEWLKRAPFDGESQWKSVRCSRRRISARSSRPSCAARAAHPGAGGAEQVGRGREPDVIERTAVSKPSGGSSLRRLITGPSRAWCATSASPRISPRRRSSPPSSSGREPGRTRQSGGLAHGPRQSIGAIDRTAPRQGSTSARRRSSVARAGTSATRGTAEDLGRPRSTTP